MIGLLLGIAFICGIMVGASIVVAVFAISGKRNAPRVVIARNEQADVHWTCEPGKRPTWKVTPK